MRLRLLTGHYLGSRPGVDTRWFAGEEREVPDETGAYLLDVFGGRFALVEPAPAVSVDVSAPPLDRRMRAPPKRRG